jgi:hypothetical protein
MGNRELSLAIEHVENAFWEGAYTPCEADCPSCVDSCPCRRGYRKGLYDDDNCSHCYTVADPDGIEARDWAIRGMSDAGLAYRKISSRLGVSIARISDILNGR